MSSYNDYLNSLQSYTKSAEVPMFNTGGSFSMPAGNSPQNIFRASEIARMPGADSLNGVSGQSWLDSLKGIGSGVNNFLKDIGFIGSTDTKTNIKTDGWGGDVISGITGGFGAYNAMGQLDLAKQAFGLQKEVALANLSGTKKTINTRYEDRQNARRASNSGYESVGSYMQKNKIA